MEIGDIIFRGGTSLDEVQACPLIHNNERVFKLSRAFGIQPEIRLQRNRYLHAFRHVHERTARPYCAVQCGEFMIARRDELHKTFLHHVGVFAFQGALHIRVHHALRRHFFFYVVIHKFRVVLRTDAG